MQRTRRIEITVKIKKGRYISVHLVDFKMEDVVNEVLAQANESTTENANATSTRIPSTPEGMVIAYGSLVIMAILPIFLGSYRSVKHHKEQKVRHMFMTHKLPRTQL